MKLVLAAPASALPFLSMAFASHAGAAAALKSFSHFLMKLVLAAPLSFLSAACASQVDAACAAPNDRQAPRAIRERSFFMME